MDQNKDRHINKNRTIDMRPAVWIVAPLALLIAWAAFHALFGWPFGRWL